MLHTIPLWRDEHARPGDLPTEDIPESADVVVVGAGYTGLAAAIRLRASGLSSIVVDAGEIGSGASSVNGGMVNIGLKAPIETIWRRYGELRAREFWDAGMQAFETVRDVVASRGIDCDFSLSGGVELGTNARDLEAFRRSAEWIWDRLGHHIEVLGGDRIHEVVGSRMFTAAALDPMGAGLHPAKYVYGLARVAKEAGAVLVEDAAVTSISRHLSGYQVLTSRGKIAAGEVLLATNGYTGRRPVAGLRRRVIPIGSYIVVTEPLEAQVAERLIPGGRMLWTAKRFLNYFRRTPDDRILMGGRNDLSTDLDLTESAAVLSRRTVEVFPELEETTFTHSWTGRLGVTFDLMPHIGRIDGVWYALGYGGHGVAIATHLGGVVGGRIAGEDEPGPFEEIPHPTRPYYRSEPWFLPAAARLYRFLDAVGR